MGVLRFEASGPPYFEFRDDGVLRWPEGAVISDVRLGSSLEAFNNQSMAIYGDDNKQVCYRERGLLKTTIYFILYTKRNAHYNIAEMCISGVI